jgi:NADH-quinone oxidoreductase subunit J
VSLVEALFGLLGLVALGSALLVVTTRQLVHAALWLVVTLGSIAGCYLLLSAEFVAWVQVLIYVGAVVVLLLFGLMLTRAPIGVSADLDGPPMQRVAAAVVALGGERIRLGDDRVAGSSASAGAALFRAWVLPFEVLSVLLLAALVGAIVLSRRDIGGGEGARD